MKSDFNCLCFVPMYNRVMLRSLFILLVPMFLYGCATTEVYNPVKSALEGTYILNGSSLSAIKTGMTQKEVHEIMGQEIVIGYEYQNASAEKPITITNPYKTETISTAQGECIVEYYVTSVQHPDGVVSGDEMVPLTFCKGVLTSKGGAVK